MRAFSERPGADEYASFYASYVARVPDGDILATLKRQIDETCTLIERAGEGRADHAYAPGKWTIREVIGHLADGERIFSYRALRFARDDATELTGFDETKYVPAGGFANRSLDSLLGEFRAIRAATVALFAGLPEAAWIRRGVANTNPVSVRALAWITAGHELHHRYLLQERYLR